MLTVIQNPTLATIATIRKKTATESKIVQTVAEMFTDIENSGDTAIEKYALQFDQTPADRIKIKQEELEELAATCTEDLKTAINLAIDNIRTFHLSQKRTSDPKIETSPGVFCWRRQVPIERVGLYIPGGTAPLFSSFIMLAVPALIAGCKDIIVCTPPQPNGEVHPGIAYIATSLGISEVYRLGGVQAIGAMGFGCRYFTPCYKIFGPGNQYVTEAKQQLALRGIAIDMPAGPSELCVFADQTANPDFVAADLLSQAEHGIDSQVVLISTSSNIVDKIAKSIQNQLPVLPRKEIASKALEQSFALVTDSEDLAIQLINEYAPEHLILAMDQAQEMAANIKNSGSIFLGHYSPESAGDYASGTNHTLPTQGHAKAYSGVSVDSFVKNITYQEISPDGIKNLGPAVEILAAYEGLEAHKNAVTLRLKSLEI